MLRVVACGSRFWNDQGLVDEILDDIGASCLAHGACRGADLQADDWARRHGVPRVPFPAEWQANGRSDPWAGNRRNRLMLAQFQPDVVVAFKLDFDHSFRRGGTEDMVKIARKAGVRTEVIDRAALSQLKLF